MAKNKQCRAREFVVKALLGEATDEPEYLAIIKNQLADVGTIINSHDPELMKYIARFFESAVDKRRREEIQKYR